MRLPNGWKIIVGFLIVASCTVKGQTAADDPVHLYLPLEGQGRQVLDGQGKSVGLHYVSATPDHDDPASTDPTRYRVEGHYGKAIRYFGEDRSYSMINKGPVFQQPIEALAVSLEVKFGDPDANRFASLLSTKADGDKSGFALFLWGHEVRFCFGDGKREGEIRADAGKIKDGQWHTIEASFERGKAGIWIDGVRRAQDDVSVMVIAPPQRALFLGGYPIASDEQRRRYAFDGWLDEVAIGELREPVRNYLYEKNLGRNNLPPPPALEYSVQPIDGNEPFFGGQKVFHTFRNYPVPLTFLFRCRTEALEKDDKPALVMYVPENVKMVALFQSHHGQPECTIASEIKPVMREGRRWIRYATKGIDLTKGGLAWQRSPQITWAFDAGANVKESPIRYGLVYGGKEHELTQATIRFLDLPAPVPDDRRGQFQVFAYFNLSTFAYPDMTLQQASADLLKSIGLTGKGRFYSYGGYRTKFDALLKDQGFTLYQIALWQGPDVHKMAVDPQDTTKQYIASVANLLKPSGMNECVTFDYEPWRVPYMPKSFEPAILTLFAKWAKLNDVPNQRDIMKKFRRQWTDFWLHVGEDEYSAMSQAVRTHHPDPKAIRVAFTYFFPYNDEEKLYQRFWSIPKDPRKAEAFYDVHLISLYVTNGRKLVDKVRLAQKYLHKPIWGISAVSRVNPIQESYTSPEDSLSPQRLEQKLVLCAALGMKRHGLWPGRGWIDGKHLEAIGRASRFIWEREAFYFDGQSMPGGVGVTPEGNTSRDEWTYTTHSADNQWLVSVFNFSNKPKTFRISLKDKDKADTCIVPPNGYLTKRYAVSSD